MTQSKYLCKIVAGDQSHSDIFIAEHPDDARYAAAKQWKILNPANITVIFRGPVIQQHLMEQFNGR